MVAVDIEILGKVHSVEVGVSSKVIGETGRWSGDLGFFFLWCLRLHGGEGFRGLDWFKVSEARDTTGDVSSSLSGSWM